MKYDALIVGSGVSGMTAAGLLALEGKRVLLLEQHNVFGGLMQTYRRGRLTFPTGVHSLGGFDEGQVGWRYFDYLGILDRLDLVPMNPNAFQQFVFPNETYDIPVGRDAFRERLLEHFPEERTAIERFMEDMNAVLSQSPFYTLDPEKVMTPDALPSMPLADYLNRLTSSPDLRRVLAANYPLHGILPKDCPVFTHFAVTDSYLQSAYRVDERNKSIAKAFMFRLRELGVDMRRGEEVAEVLCEGRSVSGVRMASGETFASDIVIYTGHPKELVQRCSAFRPVFRDRILELQDTVGFFTACFAWDEDVCPPASSDVFIYNTYDLDAAPASWNPASPESLGVLYLSASPRPEKGRYPLVAIAAAYYDEWREWSESMTGERERDYAARKADMVDCMQQVMRSRMPAAGDAFSYIDSNTPLTLADYTLSPAGTGYGLRKSANALLKSQVGVRTSVRGLFMAGQSCQLPGILGSMISAVNACTSIPGHEAILEKIARSTA